MELVQECRSCCLGDVSCKEGLIAMDLVQECRSCCLGEVSCKEGLIAMELVQECRSCCLGDVSKRAELDISTPSQVVQTELTCSVEMMTG
jgi:hypothetical protein